MKMLIKQIKSTENKSDQLQPWHNLSIYDLNKSGDESDFTYVSVSNISNNISKNIKSEVRRARFRSSQSNSLNNKRSKNEVKELKTHIDPLTEDNET